MIVPTNKFYISMPGDEFCKGSVEAENQKAAFDLLILKFQEELTEKYNDDNIGNVYECSVYRGHKVYPDIDIYTMAENDFDDLSDISVENAYWELETKIFGKTKNSLKDDFNELKTEKNRKDYRAFVLEKENDFDNKITLAFHEMLKEKFDLDFYGLELSEEECFLVRLKKDNDSYYLELAKKEQGADDVIQ